MQYSPQLELLNKEKLVLINKLVCSSPLFLDNGKLGEGGGRGGGAAAAQRIVLIYFHRVTRNITALRAVSDRLALERNSPRRNFAINFNPFGYCQHIPDES